MSEALQRTEAEQARASDPAASAWVRANAGTGKTHVLVQRVLRLLLTGTSPDGIVCLTFTKAAAAEMANRLTRLLGEWAVAPRDDLGERLGRLLGRAPSEEEMARAQRLFCHVLDTPGGLRIQTIHAFCERILRQFPLESGVAPGFSVLAEAESLARLRAAIRSVLEDTAAAPDDLLDRDLETVAAHVREDRFEQLLEAALRHGHVLRQMIRATEVENTTLEALIADALGAPVEVDLGATERAQAEVLSTARIDRAVAALLATGGKRDAERAADLQRAVEASDPASRIEAFRAAFMTGAGKPRSDNGFPSKAVLDGAPDVAADLRAARDHFADLEATRVALETAQASAALFRVTDTVIQRYEGGKQADGALDYDDLIGRTVDLLSHGSAWVLYRLDGGIEHLLIDEAQDNSRAQWQVAELLSQEFFAGETAGAADRSLFAVGDEKQSIYGFQGAAPEHFTELATAFRDRAGAARHTWHDVPLTRSFRTVEPILQAVDLVFGGENGLGARIGARAAVAHEAHREGEAGLVEVWPTEKPPERTDSDPWAPLDEPREGTEAVHRLAARIADRIKGWIESGEVLASQGRPIRPSDILILVRKRQPFAGPMIAALKSRGVPVAGADRMRLTDQLAVKDLMALGDALLLPGDDLSLAAVLKSPLFGASEDDLFMLAHERDGSLWEALEEASAQDPQCAAMEARLALWRSEALSLRPFEFYAAVLDRDGARDRLIAQVGPEAADAIDEFLNLALAHEETGPATLQGFLAWLRETGSEVRRDMEQGADQVRVMTVHGAKGLEANIVILPDTCSMGAARGGPLVRVPRDAPPAFDTCLAWAVSSAARLPAIEQVQRARQARDEAESYRLLYVAMTRARDRLYITGFESRKPRGRDEGCWYDLVYAALEGQAQHRAADDGGSVLRLETKPSTVPAATRPAAAPEPAITPPEWLRKQAPAEVPVIPESPSAHGEPADMQPSGAPRSAKIARRRGELIHLLLEWLPEVSPDSREIEAERIADTAGAGQTADGLDSAVRTEAIITALAIVNEPDFAHLFGPGSRAEVPVAADMDRSGELARLSGRIDRLVVRDSDILVIDYKTDAHVPPAAEGAPGAYIAQLSAYCRALRPLFPDKSVRSFILWTSGPALMEIPSRTGGASAGA